MFWLFYIGIRVIKKLTFSTKETEKDILNISIAEKFIKDDMNSLLSSLNNSKSSHLCILSYLNSEIFDNKKKFNQINEGLKSKDAAVIIRNAFKIEFAEELYTVLDSVTNWPILENIISPDFSMRQHALTANDNCPDELTVAKLIFFNMQTRLFMQKLASTATLSQPDFYAGYFHSGDYASPHTDWSPNRRLSWVFHLTKYWNPKWGGSFHWGPSDTNVPPEFNTLAMFRVTPTGTHSVLPVTPLARSKRLTINGWFYSEDKIIYENKQLPDLNNQIMVLKKQ